VIVSVIVPVRDDPRLSVCLGALDAQTLSKDDFEVLVVGDGEDERVARIAAGHRARYLEADRRGSYAARNRGIEAARGALLVFTDSDCVPPPRWLEEVVRVFDDPTCRIALGPSTSANETPVARWVQDVDDARWRALLAQEPGTAAYCDTRNFAARREVFDAELFDPGFRWAGDLELGYRLARRGERLRLAPEMTTGHLNPTSLLAVLRRGLRRGRGLEQLHRKHGEGVRLGGARALVLLGVDVKRTVLGLARTPGLRYVGALALLPVGASLLLGLEVARRIPAGRQAAAPAFRVFERFSLLLGRLVA
jgi:cellulose synthase/poly-beta-1,6-N-acetylglucosamine synthase-like glycosyltransferase